MGNRRNGHKITIQQILNMCSMVPEESISIKGIIVEFKKIKISVRETAVYYCIHRMEANHLIQIKNKDFSRKGRVGTCPLQYFLTEKGLVERDALNTINPPQTGIRSIGDYLQMPITKPSE